LAGDSFSPASISNLKFWVNVDSSITITDDGLNSIDVLHDLSGQNYNMLAVTGASHIRATYAATGLNSKPAIDFATSDFTFSSTLGALFSKVNAFTIAGTLNIDSTASATQGILTVSIANDDRFQISLTGNTNLNFAYFNGTSWIGHQVTGITAGTYYFVFAQQPGVQNPVLWLNGTQRTTSGFTSNGSIAANGIYVLGSVRETTTTSQFDGKVRDLFFYSDFKSDSDIASINAYLSSRSATATLKRFSIFAGAGQSNSGGNNAGGAPAVVNGYQYSNGAGRNYLSKDKSSFHAFSNRYITRQNSKTPVIVTQSASGVSVTTSTAINWSSSGTLRGLLKTDLDSAKTFLSKSDVDGMMWCQGEADAQLIDSSTITRAQYKTALLDLISWWNTNYPTAPFYIVRTAYETTGDTAGYQAVRAVQQEVCDENPSFVKMAYTGTINFPAQGLYDTIHWTQAQQNTVGEAVADFITQ